MVVLDASFSIPLFVSHEHSSMALSVLNRLRSEEQLFTAPSLWTYEIASTLQKLRHVKYISTSEAENAAQSMASFEIELIHPDFSLVERALAWSQQLKRASAYDSFYLALAESRECDLWTADRRLANAVKATWIRLLT